MSEVTAARKWWILIAMTTAISMTFIDITVLPVALPTITRELSVTNLQLQWIVNAYTLVLTVLVLAGGRIGDMWGMRKIFYLGTALFASASALCGLSQSAGALIAYRALQGVGGACLIPSTQSIIYSSFPAHQRGKAIGLFVSIGSIFLSLGPLIGGSLTQYASWRYVFWINIPIALAGLLLTALFVPSFKGNKEKFDFWGFLTIVIGISAIVVGCMQAQDWGWLSSATFLCFCAGILFLLLHFKMHRYMSHPLIDFQLFTHRSFTAGLSCFAISQFIVMAPVYWALYFQDVLHFSPSKAGNLSFLTNIPVIVGAPLAGWMVDRLGPRLPVCIGYSLVSVGLILFFLFLGVTEIGHLLMILIPYGIGIVMTFTPSSISIFSETPSAKRGIASGLNATVRQFSATLGLALFGTVFSMTQTSHMEKALQLHPQTSHLSAKSLEGLLSHAPSAVAIVDQLSSQNASFVIDAARKSFISSIFSINMFALVVSLLGIWISASFLTNRPLHVPWKK